MATVSKKEKKKSLQEVYHEKSERVLEGVAYWASFYRKNPQRFVLEYLNVKLKLFQKNLQFEIFRANKKQEEPWLKFLQIRS